MGELTIEAGIARGLMRFAVSKGASQQALAERSGIDPAGRTTASRSCATSP